MVRVESRVNDAVTGTLLPATASHHMGSYKPPEWYSTEKPDRSHNERGGLILSEDEALSLRERLRAVEVQIDYLRRDFNGMRDDMREVVASVGRLTDLVSAARGARWAFIGLIAFIGAASTYLPTVVRMILSAAK